MKGRGSEVRRPKAIDSRVSQTAYNYQKISNYILINLRNAPLAAQFMVFIIKIQVFNIC